MIRATARRIDDDARARTVRSSRVRIRGRGRGDVDSAQQLARMHRRRVEREARVEDDARRRARGNSSEDGR